MTKATFRRHHVFLNILLKYVHFVFLIHLGNMFIIPSSCVIPVTFDEIPSSPKWQFCLVLLYFIEQCHCLHIYNGDELLRQTADKGLYNPVRFCT